MITAYYGTEQCTINVQPRPPGPGSPGVLLEVHVLEPTADLVGENFQGEALRIRWFLRTQEYNRETVFLFFFLSLARMTAGFI